MTARQDARPALAVALLVMAVAALSCHVALTWHGATVPKPEGQLFHYLVLVIFLIYALVGTVILVRRPGNAVGAIVSAVGVLPLVGGLAGEYAAQAMVQQKTSWPLLTEAAQWLSNWYFYAVIGAMPLLFLLFPDGRPVSGGARHLVRLALVGLMTALLRGMVGPSDDPALPNPYALDLSRGLVAAADVVVPALLLVGLVGGLSSLVVRYRRARGVERQQVTCLLYTAAAAVLLFFLNDVLPGDAAFLVAAFLPALGVGAAVLRFRLYDIDRLVSRTVSYALLSGMLALPYALVVTGASRLGGNNQAAVALATLTAAAAFHPLRRRVQDRVDRRFNRSRYDAARSVQAFTDRLRQEVDLDTVRADLLDVVRQTVQPTTATLWLRARP